MSTFTAIPISLKTMLERVRSGSIQLPDFQRGWVWDDDRIKGLLISISRGFPVGAVMTLDAGGDIRFQSRVIEGVDGNGIQQAEEFLLDGQQRLTSLFQAMLYGGPVETRDRPGGRRVIKRWYYVDIRKILDPLVDRDDTIFSVPEDRVIKTDFGQKIALDLSSKHLEFEHHMIPTEHVLDGMGWGFKYAQYWEHRDGHPDSDGAFDFFERFKNVVLNNFTEYQLPVIKLGKGTPKEAVCTVFEKVNTGGVTLNVFELVTASFAADNFSLRDDWDARSRRLHSEFGVLHGIKGDHFLQSVTLLATQDQYRDRVSENELTIQAPGVGCKRADILNLTLGEYLKWADLVEEGLRDAAKFLHGQFIFTAANVPYNTQLVPLAALCVSLGDKLATANAQEKLNHWFWCGIFGEFYGSAVESQFVRDLLQVARYVQGGREPELVTEANFIPERLLSLRTRNSAAYKGLYALQMKRGAADWISGQPLSLATWHGEGIDIHHIFPVAWCKGADPPVPSRLYDSIINKTPIDALTNRKLGGQRPSRYLRRLRKDIDEDKLKRILESHWVDVADIERDRFDKCFVERGQAMLDLVNQAMHKPEVDGRLVFRNALGSAGLTMDPYSRDEEVEYDPVGDSAYGMP